MARTSWTRLCYAVGFTTAGLTACSDSVTAPPNEAKPIEAPASLDVTLDTASILPILSNRFAYAWADNPVAAFYAPAAAYSYNAKGGANTISRTGVGAYTVHFGLMAKGAFPLVNRETILVTAYGAVATRCIVGSWGDSGGNLDVRVLCANVAGNPVDSRFTILLVGSNSLMGRSGFAWADQPANPLYIPALAYSYTSKNDTIKINRFGIGNYNVDLKLPRPAGGLPENYFVTAYGSPRTLCKIGSWGSTARVLCYLTTGAAVDSRYDALLVERGRLGRRLGFAWADQPASAGYFPNAFYRQNTSGGSIWITRSGVGQYGVLFRGLQKLAGHTETIQISSYGAGFTSCNVVNWFNVAPTDMRANVECRNQFGVLTDSRYQIMVIE
jgi:hypothetical protein